MGYRPVAVIVPQLDRPSRTVEPEPRFAALTEGVDVGRRVIVGIDRDPVAAAAMENGRHARLYQKPNLRSRFSGAGVVGQAAAKRPIAPAGARAGAVSVGVRLDSRLFGQATGLSALAPRPNWELWNRYLSLFPPPVEDCPLL